MVYKSFKGDSIGGKVLRGPSKVDRDSKKSQTRSRKGMYVIDPMTALYICVPMRALCLNASLLLAPPN